MTIIRVAKVATAVAVSCMFLVCVCAAASTPFTAGFEYIRNTPDNAGPIAVGDLNGDGRADFVMTRRNGGLNVWWHERVSATSWSGAKEISSTNRVFTQMRVADVDGDGDNDVFVAYRNGMQWFENTDGTGEAFAGHTIEGTFNFDEDVYFDWRASPPQLAVADEDRLYMLDRPSTPSDPWTGSTTSIGGEARGVGFGTFDLGGSIDVAVLQTDGLFWYASGGGSARTVSGVGGLSDLYVESVSGGLDDLFVRSGNDIVHFETTIPPPPPLPPSPPGPPSPPSPPPPPPPPTFPSSVIETGAMSLFVAKIAGSVEAFWDAAGSNPVYRTRVMSPAPSPAVAVSGSLFPVPVWHGLGDVDGISGDDYVFMTGASVLWVPQRRATHATIESTSFGATGGLVNTFTCKLRDGGGELAVKTGVDYGIDAFARTKRASGAVEDQGALVATSASTLQVSLNSIEFEEYVAGVVVRGTESPGSLTPVPRSLIANNSLATPTSSPIVNGAYSFTITLRGASGAVVPRDPSVPYAPPLVFEAVTPGGVVESIVTDGVDEVTVSTTLATLSLYTFQGWIDGVPVVGLPHVVDLRASANLTTTTVLSANFVAGSPVSFNVVVRDMSGNAFVGSGIDFAQNVSVEIDRDGLETVPVTLTNTPFGVQVDAVPPTLSLYTVSIRVDSVHIPGSPFQFDTRLSAANCSVVDAPASRTYSFPTRSDVVLRMKLSGPSGVAPAVVNGYNFDNEVEATLSLGSTFADVSVVGVNDASFVGVEISFSFPIAAFYTLSLKVDGEDVPGSPFLVELTLDCPVGTRVNGDVCTPCEPNFYSDVESQTQCSPCATGMSSPEGSISFLNCSCAPGTWLGTGVRTRTSVCEPCPTGASCAGQFALPEAQLGFFQPDASKADFAQCLRAGCLGARGCVDGYTGYLCGKCEAGFYSRSEVECAKCQPETGLRLVAVAAVLILVALISIVFIVWSMYRMSSNSEKAQAGELTAQGKILAFRARTAPVTISMILVSFQIIGVLAEANFSWTSDSKTMLNVFTVFNVDARVLAAECVMDSFYTMYVVSVILPFVFLLLIVLGVGLAGAIARCTGRLASLANVKIRFVVDTVLFAMAPLLYIPIAKSALVLFDCSKISNGDIVLDSDNGVLCFDSNWWGVFPAGLFAVIVYVFGVPFYFAVTLKQRSHKLFHPDTTSRFGSLYRNYRCAFYWGELANLAKRLIIVLVATFLSRHQLVQALMLLALLVLSLFFVARYQPYYVHMYNGVETRLTLILTAIVLIGASSYASRATDSNNALLLVATIVALLVFGVVCVHALFADVRSILAERRAGGPTARDRQVRLSRIVSTELADVEPNAELLRSAGEFLVALDKVSQQSFVVAEKTRRPTKVDEFGFDITGGHDIDEV